MIQDTNISTILLDEQIIEIHYNPNLSKNQFLVRCIGWNEKSEFRLSKDELGKISEYLNLIVNDHED